MNILTTALEGILIIEPVVYTDNRGYFMETYHRERYHKEGILPNPVQDNLAYSEKGTLRGLHFQVKHPQAKLVQVIFGEIFDAAVDLRPDSGGVGLHEDVLVRQRLVGEAFLAVLVKRLQAARLRDEIGRLAELHRALQDRNCP